MVRILLAFLSVFSGQFFTRIGVDDGLSQMTVTSIVQDSTGQMWFGTMSGLNRYDGNMVYTYYHSDTDSLSISSNMVNFLFSDSDGRLWVSSGGGLDLYCPKEDNFIHIREEKNFRTIAMAEMRDGSILVGNNLKMYSVSANRSGGFDVDELAVPSDDGNYYLAGADDGYYVSSGTDIFHFGYSAGSFDRLDFIPSTNSISGLLYRDGELWIASNTEGLLRVRISDRSCVKYASSPESICSNSVKRLCFDKDGKLWIGTRMNVSVLDVESGAFTTIVSDRLDPRSLSNNSVISLCCDRDGGVWLGTFFGGVNYYHNLRNRFSTIRINYPFVEDIIGGMAIDSDGILWLGTNRNGIQCFNTATGESSHILFSDNPVENDIKSIHFSSNGDRVFVASALDGLYVIDRSGRHVKKYSAPDNPRMVYSILESKDSTIWIGTMSGVYAFNEAEGKSKKVHFEGIPHLPVMKMILDSSGYVWIGAENCLLRCRLFIDCDGNPGYKDLSVIRGVSRVQDMLQASDESVWVATKEGLFSYKDGTAAVVPLKSSTKMTRSIEEDSDGNLWIGTENGLIRLELPGMKETVFTSKDGLPSNTFCEFSHVRGSDGTLYFGGVRGALFFRPDEMTHSPHPVVPVITSVIAGGRKVDVLPRIVVRHSERELQIGYASYDYSSWQQGLFRYELDGYDNGFRPGDNSRKAYYSNLRPGKYRFILEYANPDGEWTRADLSPEIKVLAPWYRSIPMIAFYVLSILTGLFFLVRLLENRIAERNRKETENYLNEQRNELDRLRKYSEINLRKALCLRFAGTEFLPDEDYKILQKASEIIRANLSNEQFSVEQLADALSMSRSALHRHLTAITGDSALMFIKRIKFDEACRLLTAEKIPVSEVGYRMGFKNPSYFSTSFKNFIGVTPRDYVKTFEEATNLK